jgi:hypothetical protein
MIIVDRILIVPFAERRKRYQWNRTITKRGLIEDDEECTIVFVGFGT